MKFKPFLDSFQGCFKNKCRYFAGLFFVYHIVLLLPITYSDSIAIAYINSLIVLFVILLLHCFVQPFENKWHNRFDAFLLLDLFFVNMLTTCNHFIIVWRVSTNQMNTAIPVLQVILMLAPVIIALGVPIRQYFSKKLKGYFANKTPQLETIDVNWPSRLLESNLVSSEPYRAIQ